MLGDAREEFEKVGLPAGRRRVRDRRWGMRRIAAISSIVALAAAERARKMMQDLKNPRGEAACQRLLSMIAFDTGDVMRSREHALSASALYDQMGEPRGQVEASMLLAQVALATRNPVAGELIRACDAIGLVEAETRQHLALSKSWLCHSAGLFEEAEAELEIARLSFGEPSRTGDHTRQLLARLAELPWSVEARARMLEWRAEIGAARPGSMHDESVLGEQEI